QLLMEVRRHRVTAGNARRLAQRRLRLPLAEVRAVVLFEVVPIVACDGETPIAERFLRIAVIARTEKRRHRMTATLRLSVGDGLERLVDGAIEVLCQSAERTIESARDGVADRIVRDSGCAAGADERLRIGRRYVDALAGATAEKVFRELY